MFRFYGKKSRSNKLCYSSQVIKTLTYFTLKNNNRNVFFYVSLFLIILCQITILNDFIVLILHPPQGGGDLQNNLDILESIRNI